MIDHICEILFVFFWSLGSYTQLYRTIKSKSGDGFSLNYQFLALFTTVYFAIYNTYLLLIEVTFFTVIDALYTYQSIIISSILLGFTMYYPRKNNKFSKSPFLIFFSTIGCIISFYIIGAEYYDLMIEELLLFIGISKVNVSILKYSYQILLNIDRKNLYGFSPWNFNSDFLGAFLSILQVIF